MAGNELNDEARRHLDDLLAEDRPDGERLIHALSELRQRHRAAAFAETLRRLAHLVVSDEEGEAILQRILAHRAALASALDRDPGLRVAATDFLTNIDARLTNPKIVESAEFERTLESAMTDPLTGLFNRRQFHQVLERECARSRRHGSTFSLVLLDVDGFKAVNDEHGHVSGDVALRKIARVIRRGVRDADAACRLGGDEFALVLPETERLGAYLVADRLRSRIEATFARTGAGGKDVRLTVSGGIAVHPTDGSTPSQLVDRADRGLYEAKREGRNRVRLHFDERRTSIRFPVRPSVKIRVRAAADGDADSPARGVDLSCSGALIETDRAFAPDDRVHVVIGGAPAGDGAPRELAGRVVRVEPPRSGRTRPRVGIAFERLLSEELLAGRVLLVGAAERGRGGAP